MINLPAPSCGAAAASFVFSASSLQVSASESRTPSHSLPFSADGGQVLNIIMLYYNIQDLRSTVRHNNTKIVRNAKESNAGTISGKSPKEGLAIV